MLIEAAIFTNPRLSDHSAAIAETYTTGILSEAISFGGEFVLERHNYYIFSTASLKGVTVSYGAFGYVNPLIVEI